MSTAAEEDDGANDSKPLILGRVFDLDQCARCDLLLGL
jgi:hypothetical protein